MSESTIQAGEAFIKHHGVKGMKWGVRRAAKKTAKADAKWEKKALTRKTVVELWNAGAVGSDKELPALNAKYAGKNLLTDLKAKARYDQEVVNLFNKHVSAAAKERGLSPSGTKRLEATINPITSEFFIKTVEIEHAVMDGRIVLKVERDENGFIISISVPPSAMSQSGMTLEEVLEHHGVKGMKWGVRRKRSSTASADAQRHKTNKKKKVSELSDQELRDLVGRINMEKQISSLKPSKAKKGHEAVKAVLAVGATVNSAIAFAKSPAGQAIRKKLIG